MIPKKELQDWLNTLPDDADIGIDDGGMLLVTAADDDAYLEVGGVPADEEGSKEHYKTWDTGGGGGE